MPFGRHAGLKLQAGLALGLLILCGAPPARCDTVRVGVLAKRGEAICLDRWGPTAEYLDREIPEHHFEIVPLTFAQIRPAVEQRRIDFLLTNSSMYVDLEVTCGASRIATMLNQRDGLTYSQFAGIVFARADRTDIRDYGDLRGKRFMAVDERSLGGWHMALREFQERGIDPHRDFRSLEFAGTHDSVVIAVQRGEVDAGTVRTDILSRMAAAGRIRFDDFHILDTDTGEHYHPFPHSTRFYPEWPMAQLAHVETDLAREVAAALMRIPPDSEAARAAEIHGWTVPANYQSVHELLRELRMEPYADFGRATPADVLRHFRLEILIIVLLIGVLAYSTLKAGRLNSELRQSKRSLEEEREALQRAHDELDDRVRERAAELVATNESLQREIAARVRTSEALFDSEIKYRALVEGTIDAIFGCDANGIIVSWNHSAQEMFGYAPYEIVGRSSRVLMPADRQDEYEVLLARVRRLGYVDRFETARRAADGREIPVEITITAMGDDSDEITGYSSIVRDITERLEAEREKELLQSQLLHMQKMEAIGTLAGGIAHDFNNLLTIINGHADLAITTVSPESALGQDLAAIVHAGDQAANLTRQLLAFSRKQVIEPKVLDLNRVIRDFDRMLGRLIGEDIRIETDLDGALPRIHADPGQIEQILANLIVNARDAVNAVDDPSRDKMIRIETRSPAGGSEVRTGAGPDADRRILLAISDNGVGMDAAVQEKMFEPFFTTKGTGEGTGLGMSTVYGIVQQNSASILVSSEPQRGTRVEILWPCSPEAAPGAPAAVAATESLRGTERILVAEDEEAICRLAAAALGKLGYEVHVAGNGVEALRLVRRTGLQFDLLLTDVVMPEMDGIELAAKMRALQPEVAVLYTSGYPNRMLSDSAKQDGALHFLQKPYTASVVAREIRRILDAARPAAGAGRHPVRRSDPAS